MSKKRKIVSIENVNPLERYRDIFQDHFPNKIIGLESDKGNVFKFNCANRISLQISVLSEKIFRFRYALKGKFQPDFSYAIDEKYVPEIPKTTFQERDNSFEISTLALKCLINKQDLTIKIEDHNGNLICEDDRGYSARTSILNGVENVSITKKAKTGETFFGLGDKSSSLNLRGKKFENWNTDSFLYDDKTDPLYRSIPFYYSLNQGIGYGIFLDNSFRSHFDFDSKKDGTITFTAEGGEMNYYFIYGPELLSVAKDYCLITGKPGLPPIWALGFHQCQFSYYPESKVKAIAKEFRDRKIPCDAIYLDIDYMDGFRCFTWDKSHFPNPSEMVKDLRSKGFKTIVMIDPGLKEDENYDVFVEGRNRDYFCKRANGDLMIGPVWPSDCAFPDFTNPAVRSWWGHLYRILYSKNAIAGFWNDMNEPALFKIDRKTFPDDVRHYYEGQSASHAQVHNVYGMQMSRATYEGLLKLKNHRRPFVITRATFSGGQRYASVWTGDNTSNWKHLKIANIQCQRLSISGFSFVGSDVGGFAEQPTGELLVRWLQLGVFHPLFRIHNIGENTEGDAEIVESDLHPKKSIDQEPWSFGEQYTKLAKYAIELRYQLLPYIYTAFWEYVDKGNPMIKSMSFQFQNDEIAIQQEREFIFGNQLLISPIVKKGKTNQKLYLPEGLWYHYWTARAFEGKQKIEINAPLSQIPIFIKAGSVIPHYPIRQYTDEKPVDELTLHVYFKNGMAESKLYEDEGDGFEYRNEAFSLKEFQFSGAKDEVKLTQHKKGQWVDTYQTCNVLFYGLPFEPKKCIADNKEKQLRPIEIGKNKVFVLTIQNSFEEVILNSK